MTQLIENKYACFGCAACQAVCPQNAITMAFDTEGFPYPKIQEDRCVDCGQCLNICPGKQPVKGIKGRVYALRCNEQKLLQASSSGGAFSLLAEATLQDGGLICGAVYDEDFNVCHILSENIGAMRKSKYIQSDVAGIYEPISTALKEGRKVLFTGTPCQCDGLRQYFGEDNKNLMLAALICRGVQSPGLWKDYTAYLSGSGKLEAYCCRDKRVKNDGHTVAYQVDGEETAVSMGNDPFSRLYMKCLTLRPSCYQCPYTRQDLPFDLTIGDFWGVEKVFPQLADGMGTSLVIARTELGQSLLEKVRPHAQLLECSAEDAVQPALQEPAKETLLRKLLFRDYARKDEQGRCDVPLILKKYGG